MTSVAKVGLIVEGRTEEVVLRDMLRRHLQSKNPRLPVDKALGRITPDGGDRIRNKDWVAEQVTKLRQGHHDHVAVVADQEKYRSAEVVRKRLTSCGADGVFVVSPKFERWLLADRDAVQQVIGRPRPANWRSRDPLEVLEALKPGYKKVADGTLLGRASSAVTWAQEEPEFCELLRSIEVWLRLMPTECGEARTRRATKQTRGRRRVRSDR